GAVRVPVSARRVVVGLLVLVAVAAITAAALLWLGSRDAGFEATDVSGVTWGRDFRLMGDDGVVHQLADFRGKAVALYFGYTRCPHLCPPPPAALGQAVR